MSEQPIDGIVIDATPDSQAAYEGDSMSKSNAAPDYYELWQKLEDACQDHCGCEYGDAASPAFGEGDEGSDATIIVCCDHCDLEVEAPLKTEADIPIIVAAWKAAIEQSPKGKRITLT